jgi:hypothetical protein
MLLLEQKQSLDFAQERLRQFSIKGSRFMKIAAAAALKRAFPDNKQFHIQLSFYLEQLDTGGELKESEYYSACLRCLGL